MGRCLDTCNARSDFQSALAFMEGLAAAIISPVFFGRSLPFVYYPRNSINMTR